MLVPAIVLASILTKGAAVPPGLVAAITRDKDVAACANQTGKSSQAYVAGAFDLKHVTLRNGDRMSVAEATDACLALGQSTRIMIFQQTPHRYRRVLNEVSLPGLARIRSDGTVALPTHESMDIIFEATYVWNRSTYVLDPLRSHRYDVTLGERRPYEIAVHFGPGATSATLSGSVANNFGEDYVFEATAGQLVTIELTKHAARSPRIALYYGNGMVSIAKLDTAGKLTKKLRESGAYHLLVSGSDEYSEVRPSYYAIRLSIR